MIQELAGVTQGVLATFGIQIDNVKFLKEPMHKTSTPLCVIVGIVGKDGERKGVFSFEYQQSFAKNVLQAMLGGYEVDLFSEMGISALLELSNMLSGNMLGVVAPQAVTTPPTAVFGQNMKSLLNVLECYKMVFIMQNSSFSIGISIV
ncbi:chemotaxis protein CheX [Pseudothermotoga sp. U03pept]|uniref:chemotaxis protein CheX n=1 Tax=Pseudothermotoga sp. U03pept TaxID=3447012 RepID=UPI003F067145